MAFDVELLELMPHTFQIAAHTGEGFYPRSETYAADAEVRGYWQQSGETITTVTGEETNSVSIAYLRGGVDVDVDSRVTLPDGSTPPILKVEEYDDGDGDAYVTVVHFGG